MNSPCCRLLNLLRPALLFLLLGVATSASAQRGCDTAKAMRPIVKADLGRQILTTPLPFNVRFNLEIKVPQLVPDSGEPFTPTDVALEYGLPKLVRFPGGGVWGIDPIAPREEVSLRSYVQMPDLVFGIEPLAPGRIYYFDFILTGTPKGAAMPQVDTVRIVVRPRTDLANHFDADLAVIRSSRAEYVGLGSNAHLYAVPINRNECTSDYRGMDHLLKRVSVFGGLSLVKLDAEADVNHQFQAGTPMFGIGLNRLPYLGPLRINAGVVRLKQDDANPLVDRDRLKWDTFVSLGVDVELKSLLGPLTGLAAGLR